MPWITLLFKASGELRLFDGIRGENRRPFHRHSGIGLQTLPYPSRKCELGTARMSEAEEGGFAGDFRILLVWFWRSFAVAVDRDAVPFGSNSYATELTFRDKLLFHALVEVCQKEFDCLGAKSTVNSPRLGQ